MRKNGYDLIITGRRQERLTALKEILESTYKIQVLDLCFDIRHLNKVEQAILSLSAAHKKISAVLFPIPEVAPVIKTNIINNFELLIYYA